MAGGLKEGKDGKLAGPLYTPPQKNTLQPNEVDGPRGGKMPEDPLGYLKG